MYAGDVHDCFTQSSFFQVLLALRRLRLRLSRCLERRATASLLLLLTALRPRSGPGGFTGVKYADGLGRAAVDWYGASKSEGKDDWCRPESGAMEQAARGFRGWMRDAEASAPTSHVRVAQEAGGLCGCGVLTVPGVAPDAGARNLWGWYFGMRACATRRHWRAAPEPAHHVRPHQYGKGPWHRLWSRHIVLALAARSRPRGKASPFDWRRQRTSIDRGGVMACLGTHRSQRVAQCRPILAPISLALTKAHKGWHGMGEIPLLQQEACLVCVPEPRNSKLPALCSLLRRETME